MMLQLAIDTNTFAKLRPIEASIRAPHFVFAVIDALEKQYGREFLETRGLRIQTTIDLSLQDAAEQSVEAGVRRNAKYDAENAALVAVDVATGDVLSMVGSRDYFDTTIDGAVNVTIGRDNRDRHLNRLRMRKPSRRDTSQRRWSMMCRRISVRMDPDGTICQRITMESIVAHSQ